MKNSVNNNSVILVDFKKRAYWNKFIMGIIIPYVLPMNLLILSFKIIDINNQIRYFILILISTLYGILGYFYVIKSDVYKIVLENDQIIIYYTKWFNNYVEKYKLTQLEFLHGMDATLFFRGGFYRLNIKNTDKPYFKSFIATIYQDIGFNKRHWTKKTIIELYDKLIQYQIPAIEREDMEIKEARKKYWENKHQENNLT